MADTAPSPDQRSLHRLREALHEFREAHAPDEEIAAARLSYRELWLGTTKALLIQAGCIAWAAAAEADRIMSLCWVVTDDDSECEGIHELVRAHVLDWQQVQETERLDTFLGGSGPTVDELRAERVRWLRQGARAGGAKPEDAEDAAQDVYIRHYAAGREAEFLRLGPGTLRVAGRNRWVDLFRKKRTEVKATRRLGGDPTLTPIAAPDAADEFDDFDLREVLSQLADKSSLLAQRARLAIHDPRNAQLLAELIQAELDAGEGILRCAFHVRQPCPRPDEIRTVLTRGLVYDHGLTIKPYLEAVGIVGENRNGALWRNLERCVTWFWYCHHRAGPLDFPDLYSRVGRFQRDGLRDPLIRHWRLREREDGTGWDPTVISERAALQACQNDPHLLPRLQRRSTALAAHLEQRLSNLPGDSDHEGAAR